MTCLDIRGNFLHLLHEESLALSPLYIKCSEVKQAILKNFALQTTSFNFCRHVFIAFVSQWNILLLAADSSEYKNNHMFRTHLCSVPASEDEESWKKIRSFLDLESNSDYKVLNSLNAAMANCLFFVLSKAQVLANPFFNKKIVWLCRLSRQQKWILNNYSDNLEILCSLRLWQL